MIVLLAHDGVAMMLGLDGLRCGMAAASAEKIR